IHTALPRGLNARLNVRQFSGSQSIFRIVQVQLNTSECFADSEWCRFTKGVKCQFPSNGRQAGITNRLVRQSEPLNETRGIQGNHPVRAERAVNHHSLHLATPGEVFEGRGSSDAEVGLSIFEFPTCLRSSNYAANRIDIDFCFRRPARIEVEPRDW